MFIQYISFTYAFKILSSRPVLLLYAYYVFCKFECFLFALTDLSVASSEMKEEKGFFFSSSSNFAV